MDFAIVGMQCILPGSPNVEHWLTACNPAFRPVSADRWPHPSQDATPGTPDHSVSLIGGWVSEPGGVIPWSERVIASVLDEANAAPKHTELVIANLSLPSPEAVQQVTQDRLPTHSSAPAQHARRFFGLKRATAVDAACASSLYAVRLAMRALESGRCTYAIAAGVQACDPSYLLVGFSQLLALSPDGTSYPLDSRANGLVVGEGAAAVVLMRLDDAVRSNRPIHGVLRGGGLGNDGRKGNLLAPDSDGQLRAMQAAWTAADLDPRTLGYVECHATGTLIGDAAEVRSLSALLEQAGPCEHPVAIGSAKGLIGHTITVAGLAGLLRAVGAVRDGFVPAGPHSPNESVRGATHLRTADGRETWPTHRPRRAAVSAFGFGGTNAHLIVDAPPPTRPTPTPRAPQGRFGIRAGLRRLLDRDRQPDLPPEPKQVEGRARQELVQTPKLTIVGAAAQIGTRRNEVLYEAIHAGRRLTDGAGRAPIGTLALDARRWRLPPLELQEMLPQQLLALELAADALETAGIEGPGVAVIIGMELASEPCHQVLRWRGESPNTPPLTAQRVLGQLPNFVANRISAQLGLEGPSYTVSAGGLSGIVAIEHAAQLLLDPALHTVVIGAVDGEGPVQGGVLFAVQRTGQAGFAELEVSTANDPRPVGPRPIEALQYLLQALFVDEPQTLGFGGAAGAAAVRVTPRTTPRTTLEPRERRLQIPQPDRARPGLFGPDPGSVVLTGEAHPARTRLHWALSTQTPRPVPAPVRNTPLQTTNPPLVAPAPPPTVPGPVLAEIEHLTALTRAMARSQSAATDAHAAFLSARHQAAEQLAQLGVSLGASLDAPPRALPKLPAPPAPAPAPPPGIPRSFDRHALELHAAGKLSEVFGPDFAHLDPHRPRTRMPMHPLLLCSRVLHTEGTPLELGPSRIVTEYDLPTDASWSKHDGKPNACVIVESGQADLFLVSWLGVEAHSQGKRVYRLLDCDLIFHGPRPEVGETLHHDIRIKRFARLGSKILFYFEYDCTSNTDGRKVLSMRNGCAGFFTPEELATPRGVDTRPRPLERPNSPVVARSTSVRSLDADAVRHLVEGRFSAAFGPAFAPCDGSRLTLPDSEWRLVHEVEEVRCVGGAHGLGLARTLQHLRDDDWFNPCHFLDDPCMPGTLMLEGCLQAVQTWLLAAGVAAEHPDGLFEPLPELAIELRCRGQVIPGHSVLTYEAQIREAQLGNDAWAIADVLLRVDGVPVVLAKNVGVTVGLRADARSERPVQTPAPTEPVVDVRKIYEYSIGDAERAFGSRYHDYAGLEPRCARMPGPPLLQMTRVQEAEQPFELRKGSEVCIDYEVPPKAWYFQTTPGTSMPFAILLETALQPCGWLTAWEAAGIKDGRNLFFRNLGGTATQHLEIWPDAGTLTTRTKQTTVAASAGLLIHRFELKVHLGSTLVYDCTTSFGYFTAAALDGQGGLPLKDEDRRAALTKHAPAVRMPFAGHPSMPRDDWRNLDQLVRADPQGGREDLGWYVAEKTIDPKEWFFTAHFFLDPVMPGSLGLEAALQLARYVFEERTGRKARCTPIRLGVPHTWKYRGQIRRPVERMTIELEVTALSADTIVFDAVLRADGMPIYELIDFGLTAAEPRQPPLPAPLPPRGPHTAALIDRFDVQGDSGTGVLRLDPARFPWLADHCPTLTAAALPLAFAAEIAAEAAQLVRPGAIVVGLPTLEAASWIHTGDGPIDLLIVAVAQGAQVAVSLAVQVENERFPKLSGPKVHMRAIVELGDRYPTAPPVPSPLKAPRVNMDVASYYGGGLTFHGPTLQGMIDLGVRNEHAAEALFQTRDDAVLNGEGLPFLLDPLLLDTATHPMVSGEPQLWVPSIGEGWLAYPVAAEGMRFYRPRPQGKVRCRLDKVHANPQSLCFDVVLIGKEGVWCSFRWTEAIVPGGPVLGQPTPVRRAFVWDGLPQPEVQIGRSVGERFRVELADLVEPIEGTLVGLCCTERELADRRSSPDRQAWTLGRLAAKGAARIHLQQRCQDVHPRDLELLDLRPDRYICVNCPTLPAQAFIDHLGPTRFHLQVEQGEGWAEAWFIETGWPT